MDCLRQSLEYSQKSCSKENKVSRRNHKLHVTSKLRWLLHNPGLPE